MRPYAFIDYIYAFKKHRSMTIKRYMTTICSIGMMINVITAKHIDIYIQAITTDATAVINQAIGSTCLSHNDSATIHLSNGSIYHISKLFATAKRYHISNTTSHDENPDPTKHIGILLRGRRNIIIDGHGSRIVTHGEMTPWVIDSCQNITIRNIAFDAADPSVTEMTVTDVTDSTLTCVPHPTSHPKIIDRKLYWVGEGWCFTNGIAQKYSPAENLTLRCPSPLTEAEYVTETTDGSLRFTLSNRPDIRIGDVYQMRHSLRTEVAGFINRSKDIRLENVEFNFMGNFGIVAQYSENLTYRNVRCAPAPDSGRTCSGFADFMQISGCKGLVNISHCYFSGSHDDPINIHGTHLKVIGFPAPDMAKVRFMHPQTYGFRAFDPGDEIDFVNAETLNCKLSARVQSCTMVNDYEQLLTLDTEIPRSIRSMSDIVVENTTWTPDVNISNNYFSLTPTRGILITTRRSVRITSNRFVKTPMSAILISDDAKNWYESGCVRDVTISGNHFEECQSPVILIWPENSLCDKPVHKNITIKENHFDNITGAPAIKARCVSSMHISDNKFSTNGQSCDQPTASMIDISECSDTVIPADN